MNSFLILILLLSYFVILILISNWTSKNDSNQDFFKAGKQSPWYIVAFGMIGASLSGVTFISVPGWVQASQFGYFHVVLGYMVGYFIVDMIVKLIKIYFNTYSNILS